MSSQADEVAWMHATGRLRFASDEKKKPSFVITERNSRNMPRKKGQ